jgi:hypothetical protein
MTYFDRIRLDVPYQTAVGKVRAALAGGRGVGDDPQAGRRPRFPFSPMSASRSRPETSR